MCPKIESSSLLKSLCASYEIAPSSVGQMCQSLGIGLFMKDETAMTIDIPDNILEGDYLARGRLRKEIEKCYQHISQQERLSLSEAWKMPAKEGNIIRSYPYFMRPFLLNLVQIYRMKTENSSYTQEEFKNFSYNMRWLFVVINNEDKGWHSADLRTLWSDGWREDDIIHFMMSEPVKYIMYHNSMMIQCLDLNNGVYVFKNSG